MKPARHAVAAALALVGITVIWGATFPLVKAALADAPPLVFNLVRMSLAALVLAAVNARHIRRVSAQHLRAGAVSGVLLALGYELQTAGLARTTPTRSAFLTGLVVIFVPLLAAVPGFARTRQPLTAMTLISVGVAFAGTLLLTANGRGPAAGGRFATGEWLTLGCAIAFALHLLSLDRAAPSTPPEVLATLQIAACAVAMFVALPLAGPVRAQLAATHATPRLAIALAVTALLATAAAFTVQSWAQHHIAPATTALLLSLEPVFALLVSVAFAGEHPAPRTLAGAALILAAILLDQARTLPAFHALQTATRSTLARKDI